MDTNGAGSTADGSFTHAATAADQDRRRRRALSAMAVIVLLILLAPLLWLLARDGGTTAAPAPAGATAVTVEELQGEDAPDGGVGGGDGDGDPEHVAPALSAEVVKGVDGGVRDDRSGRERARARDRADAGGSGSGGASASRGDGGSRDGAGSGTDDDSAVSDAGADVAVEFEPEVGAQVSDGAITQVVVTSCVQVGGVLSTKLDVRVTVTWSGGRQAVGVQLKGLSLATLLNPGALTVRVDGQDVAVPLGAKVKLGVCLAL